ncbi:MAG: UbiA family prenyltransferase [Calditrichaeota bacterium]|nr:UbiA family prenyltransferase [Calditrichota bacterium]
MVLKKLISQIIEYGRMIKFSHSIFALPFALSSAILANSRVPLTLEKLLWIIVAMVSARSAAMGFNRFVDKDIDAANPRTQKRHLVTGKIKTSEVIAFVLFSSVVFVFASAQLNALCFALSPVALAVLFLYSYTKRFTALSHYILGLALGISPVGAWIAITGSFALPPIILGFAVVFWVAGFDILYSLQDYEFDRQAGLYSIPRTVGPTKALWIARISHLFAFLLLFSLWILLQLHFIYSFGLIIIAGLLSYEHSLVKADDFSKLDMAFFNMNGVISVIFFITILGDLLLL